MNQILFVEDKRNHTALDTKQIVLFFAIALIVFGLLLSGEGVYAIYKNHQEKQAVAEKENAATKIQLVQGEDGNITVDIHSQIPVSEIIYYWNSEAPQTIKANGQTALQQVITAPMGENTLTVKTIDTNGAQVIERGTFTLSVNKPMITLSLVGDRIKVSVDSTVDLSYITYQWNSEAEKKEEMTTYENKTKFEKEIEIPVGQNTLIVKAEDIYGNQSEKSQEIKGVTKPKSRPVIQGDYIYFEVVADETISQVDFELNGKAYVIKSDVIGDSKKANYRVKLENGKNYLKIKTTTISGVTAQDLWTYEKK